MQSFFDEEKIERLIEGHFTPKEQILVRREDHARNTLTNRWHLVLERLS